MRRQVVGDISAQPASVAEEAFSRITCPPESIVFFLESGEILVEFLVVRSMDVVCQLGRNESERELIQ
jgi:hypothetical protein